MNELLQLVRDYTTPVGVILDRIEDEGWTREWLWGRLKDLDDDVLETLARISPKLREKGYDELVALRACGWLESLTASELDIGSDDHGEWCHNTWKSKAYLAYRCYQVTHCWVRLIRLAMDRKLDTWWTHLGKEEIAYLADEYRLLVRHDFDYSGPGSYGYDFQTDLRESIYDLYGEKASSEIEDLGDWVDVPAEIETLARVR